MKDLLCYSSTLLFMLEFVQRLICDLYRESHKSYLCFKAFNFHAFPLFIILLSYNMSQTQFLLSSLRFDPSQPPKAYSSFISLQKRAGFPWVSARHGITGCSKTVHKHWYESWIRQPVGCKESQEPWKESKTPPLPLWGGQQKSPH